MMSRYPGNVIVFLGILMILTSCSWIKNDDRDSEPGRTYPGAFDFERSTVPQIVNEIVPPDSLNADAYVTAVIKCPDGAQCLVPDGIIISDSLDAESSATPLHLHVEKPRQFTEDQRYRMSLEITTSPGNGEKRFRLLGYSTLEPTN